MGLDITKAIDAKKSISQEIKKDLKEKELIDDTLAILESLNNKYGLDVKEKQLRILLSSLDATGITKAIGHNKKGVLLFIRMCLRYNKDPEKKEIYAIPYKNKFGGETFSIVISYQEFIKRANQSPNFQGFKAELIDKKQVGGLVQDGTDVSNGIPKYEPLNAHEIKVVFSCRPKNGDRDYVETFYLREGNKGMGEGLTKPIPMLQKTAIKNGLSKCFPFELDELLALENDFKDEITQEQEQIETKTIDIKQAIGVSHE